MTPEERFPHLQPATARAVLGVRRAIAVAGVLVAAAALVLGLWGAHGSVWPGVAGALGVGALAALTRWVLTRMAADPTNPVPWVAVSYVAKAGVIAATLVPLKLGGLDVVLPGVGLLAALVLFSLVEVVLLARIRMSAVDGKP